MHDPLNVKIHKYVYCCHVTDTRDVINFSTTQTASLGHERNMLVCTFLALSAISCRYPQAEGCHSNYAQSLVPNR